MSRFHNRNFELLEPYEGKLSRTVLRGESSRKGADLLDILAIEHSFHSCDAAGYVETGEPVDFQTVSVRFV